MAKVYEIHQCALFKVRSKARLAKILNTTPEVLVALSKTPQYKLFITQPEICPFTGKVTKARHVQEPKRALKGIHERLRDLLARIDPPGYAHAAIKGRSYRSNAEAHKDAEEAATFDITDFYPSTSEGVVFRFFLHQLACAPDIAGLLAKLVCFRHAPDLPGCLPTGSPVSPLLSIYANKPMFDALEKLGSEYSLTFTCYVDDLTFSGAKLPPRLTKRVRSIMASHGHKMAEKKSHYFYSKAAKHITGVVVKDGKISVPHARFKKARKIEEAIGVEADDSKKYKLRQRLAGLLGEAAYLDNRYKQWAERSYAQLSGNGSTTAQNSPAARPPLVIVTSENVDDISKSAEGESSPF